MMFKNDFLNYELCDKMENVLFFLDNKFFYIFEYLNLINSAEGFVGYYCVVIHC